MKLPQINYSAPVPTLQQHDASAPARIAAQEFGVTEAAGRLANNIAESAARHQANTARSETVRRMSEWSKNHEGKEFFTPEELAELGVDGVVLQGRGSVPSHEILPELYAAEYERAIEEEGSKIMTSRFRTAYFAQSRNDFAVGHAAKVVEASKAQTKQQNAQVSVGIEDLVQAREYDFALDRVGELKIDASKKKEIKNKIRANREFAGYADLVSFEDAEGAKDALAKLRAGPSENLNELKQLEAINLLETFLKEDGTKAGVEKREATWELNRIEKNAIAGRHVDLDEYAAVVERAQNAGVEPRFFKETATAVRANRMARGVANMPVDVQMAAMQGIELTAKDTEAGITSAYMESIVKGNMAYANKDMLGYYHSINGTIPTIDFVKAAPIPGATGQLLSERKEQHDMAEETLKVSQGYLKEEEVNVLTDLLLNAKPTEIMEFSREVNSALGRDGAHLYDQLRIKRKELGSLTVVGQLSAIGQEGAARQVLKGHEYRKNNPEVIQELQEAFLPVIHEQLGGVYSQSPRYLSTIKNAILDVYAIKAVVGGQPQEVVDEDLLEDAVRTVTGGLIEHEDNIIEPPYYGAPQPVMDNWIENLHEDYIKDEGGVHHYSNKQVVDKLRNGDFMLESMGNGKYVVQTGKGAYLANKAGTSKFILKFDLNAPVVNQDDAGIRTSDDREFTGNPAVRNKFDIFQTEPSGNK